LEKIKALSKEEIFNLLPISHIDEMADKRLLIVRWFVASMLVDILLVSNLHSWIKGLNSGKTASSEEGFLANISEPGDEVPGGGAFVVLNMIMLPIIILTFCVSMCTRVLFFSRPMMMMLFAYFYGHQIICFKYDVPSVKFELTLNLIRASLCWFCS